MKKGESWEKKMFLIIFLGTEIIFMHINMFSNFTSKGVLFRNKAVNTKQPIRGFNETSESV